MDHLSLYVLLFSLSGQLITHLGSDFPPGAGVLDVMYESPSTLLSCGYDTYVRYWDLRTSARKCVMEWEEPHDSTLYCLQTDGNHLLATGSSYYGVVRLWDRRQRACLHVSIPTSTCLCHVKTLRGLHWRPVTWPRL